MRTAALPAALLLALTACVGESDPAASFSAEELELAVALGEQFLIEERERLDAGGIEYSRADGECVGVAVVDAVGVDRFVEVGVTPESLSAEGIDDPLEEVELTEDEAGALWDGFTGCDIIGELLAEELVGEDVGDDTAGCLADVLLDSESENFRNMFIEEQTGAHDPIAQRTAEERHQTREVMRAFHEELAERASDCPGGEDLLVRGGP